MPVGLVLLRDRLLVFADPNCCVYLQIIPVSTPGKRDVLQILVGIPPSIRSCWSSPLEGLFGCLDDIFTAWSLRLGFKKPLILRSKWGQATCSNEDAAEVSTAHVHCCL